MADNKDKGSAQASTVFQGYIINERGEEVPITKSMIDRSLAEAKPKSIGAHTGFTKAITDDMIPA